VRVFAAFAAPTAARADAPELWFLRVHRASRLPPPLFGGLVAMLAGAAVCSALLVPEVAADELLRRDVLASAAFFATSLGFLLGAAPVIFPASVRDLEQLRGLLPLPPERFEQVRQALLRMPTGIFLRQALLGAAVGSAHAALLFEGTPYPAASLAPAAGTVALWVMMFQIATPMLANAQLFGELGRQARPDLLLAHRLQPFGATALRPTLFVIGLQCAYPLLTLGSEDGLAVENYLGLGVSLALVAGLFLLPLRGVRRQVAAHKEETLSALDARIAALGGEGRLLEADTTDETLARAEHLLTLRGRIAAVPTWPLGLAGARRFALYVILPPLTWAAAALVERWIDQSL
jgi:hypothetical protein